MGGALTVQSSSKTVATSSIIKEHAEPFAPPTQSKFNVDEEHIDIEALCEACMLNNLIKLKFYLINKKIDINTRVHNIKYLPPSSRVSKNTGEHEMTLENATLLHLAALSGHQEIVKYLLIRKIALDVPANYILRDHPVKQYLMKSTALHFALFSSEFEIAELILTAGADPTLKMDFTYENSDFTEFNEAQKGINALHCAALWNDRETIDMVLSYNSSLELVKTDDGKTYFDLANNEDESEEDVYDEFNHDSDEDL